MLSTTFFIFFENSSSKNLDKTSPQKFFQRNRILFKKKKSLWLKKTFNFPVLLLKRLRLHIIEFPTYKGTPYLSSYIL